MAEPFKNKLLRLAAMYRELHPCILSGGILFGICECMSDVYLNYEERVYLKGLIVKLPNQRWTSYKWSILLDDNGHIQRAEWLEAVANSLPDGFVCHLA